MTGLVASVGGLFQLAPQDHDLYERIARRIAAIADDDVGMMFRSALDLLPLGRQRRATFAWQQLNGDCTAQKLALALGDCTAAERVQYRRMAKQSGQHGLGFHGSVPTDRALALADILAERSTRS